MPRRARFLLALLLPAVLLATMPAATGASVVEDYARVIRARHAGATFAQVDGCLRSELFISAMDATFGSRPGPVNKQGLVGVFYAQRDVCGEPGPKGYPIVYAADGMTLDRLGTNPQFTGAWIDALIPAVDMDGNRVEIGLNIHWRPTEPMQRSRVRGDAWLPSGAKFGADVHTFSHGLRAGAVASGQVTINGESLTLAATSDAQLEQIRYFCQVTQHPQGGAEVDC
jgi:hypothetical protein